MNRIENIILTLATAAALMVASTANANPDPCPTTGKNNRPATELSEDPRDGLLGDPRVKTETGTRTVRDIENERANAESGTRPEDGLPGLPRVKTPTGTRLPRDIGAERMNRGKNPCPENGGNKTDDVDRTRTRTANEAGSLLKHNKPVLPNPNGTRTKDSELNDRNRLMDSLKNKANKNKDANGNKSTTNTTLEIALKRTGIDPKRLKGAKTETDQYGTTITLADGTVIMTGADNDSLGTSVSSPDGSETQVYPDGRVSVRKGKDGNTITHNPNGSTVLYDPKQKSITIVDKHGRTLTRPLDFFDSWYAMGYPADAVLDLIDPLPGSKDKDNTTLQDTLRRAGISAEDLKKAKKIETSEFDKSVKITLEDGTEIWTGPDSDGYGSSVSKPNGDQVEVFPDGRVSTRKGKNGHTVTTHPDGLTTDYDPSDETMTVRDDNGNKETRTMEFWNDWFKDGHTVADLFRIYNDMPNNK